MTLKLKLEEMKEEGRLIGVEEGVKKDRSMISRLFHRLQEAGRGAEFAKAMSDETLLDNLLKEYGLSD